MILVDLFYLGIVFIMFYIGSVAVMMFIFIFLIDCSIDLMIVFVGINYFKVSLLFIVIVMLCMNFSIDSILYITELHSVLISSETFGLFKLYSVFICYCVGVFVMFIIVILFILYMTLLLIN